MEMNAHNALAKPVTYKNLIHFVLPCIAMMIITSVYSIVDGFFVSNCVGKNAFAAVNLIMPVLMGVSCIGFMIGTGGTALVSYCLGAKQQERANRVFSMLVEIILIVSVVIAATCFIMMPQIVDMLGASPLIREDTIIYGRIVILNEPFFMMFIIFQSFFAAAGKQKLGLYASISAGITNMVLDFVLLYVFHLDILGAALATLISQTAGGIMPFIYFYRPNSSTLRFRWTAIEWQPIKKSCSNGISELLNNVAVSFVAVLYNFQLMYFAAENGIAAYGVIMYVSFIFQAVFMGYAVGINPLVGYKYGAKDKKGLRAVLRKSLILTGITALAMTLLSEISAGFIADIFVGYDQELWDLTVTGFRIYAVSYLLTGFTIFASAFFTGLNNGKVSAIISVVHTLICESLAVLLLPMWLGTLGIWCSISVAELGSIIVSSSLLIYYQKKYGY